MSSNAVVARLCLVTNNEIAFSTVDKVAALRDLCEFLKVTGGQQRPEVANASSEIAQPLLKLAEDGNSRVRLFAFEALGLAAYGNEDLPEKLAGDELQALFTRLFIDVLRPTYSIIEQVIVLCTLSNLTSVSLALHPVIADSEIMLSLARLLKHRCMTIRCGAIEVMSQLAANPVHRLHVRSAVKWPELSMFLEEAQRRGIDTTFTFAAKLLRCNAGPDWGLPEMLELGFAVELNAALQAAIDKTPYPVGGDVRPLVQKLAAVVRRIAKRGLAHKLDIRSTVQKLVAAHKAALNDSTSFAFEAKEKITQSTAAALRALITHERSWEAYAVEAAENAEEWEALRDEALGVESSDEEEEPEASHPTLSEEEAAPVLSESQVMNLMSRELTPEDYELLLLLDDDTTLLGRPHHRSRVAEVGLVQMLPTLSRMEAQTFSSTQPRCIVCLLDFADADAKERSKVLPCGHIFHDDCISLWLTHSRNVCPLCSAPGVTPRSE